MEVTFSKIVTVLFVLTIGLVSGQDDAQIPLDDMEADELLTTPKPSNAKRQLPAEIPLMALKALEESMIEGSGEAEPEAPPEMPIRSRMMSYVGETAPKCSNDEDDCGGLITSCIGAKLTKLPDNLDEAVVDLNMKANAFTLITPNMFPYELPNLKKLSMASNQIADIDRAAFEKTPKLEQLYLSSNRLTLLDVEVFSSLEFLIELDLSGNQIERLPTGRMFLNAPAMKKLTLSNCSLTAVPENAFDGMTSLTQLDIGNNPIDEKTPITGSVFAALTNLTSVTLPAGVSDELVSEVCKNHGLLETVCVTPCDNRPILCASRLPPINDEVDSPPELVTVAVKKSAVESMADEVTPVAPKVIGGETASESSPPVNNTSSNKTVIGVIIGVILLAVVAVVVKKNWSRITGRGREIEGNGTVAVSRTTAEERIPEEIPLKSDSPA